MRLLPALLLPLVLLAACGEPDLPTAVARPETPAMSVTASATELFFSEYIEGSSNNKALEIYRRTPC
jgi:hypothetical protein